MIGCGVEIAGKQNPGEIISRVPCDGPFAVLLAVLLAVDTTEMRVALEREHLTW